MIGRMNHRRALAGLLTLLLVPGCASWMMNGEPPEVLVTNVTPLEASAFEQLGGRTGLGAGDSHK